jgi:hypothetical protein
MSESELRYDRMVEDALRSVVGRALEFVSQHGLPGDHHFYITFRTDDPEIEIPQHLHERYPSEMTIVLQHQFWDLEVGEQNFGVTLSFGDVPQHLRIPYRAVIAFADPSVRFGLQFDVGNGDKAAGAPEAQDTAVTSQPAPAETPAAAPEAETENVVSFDQFRKKST